MLPAYPATQCAPSGHAAYDPTPSLSFPFSRIAKEQFLYPGTDNLCRLIDEAGHRAGVSRGQAFEDFLTCSVCALSNRQMEEEYLKTIAKGYDKGRNGRRGIDSLTRAFATLITLMEQTRKDILGDVFVGGISYGEAGQFFTPDELCRLMANLSIDPEQHNETVYDPCCGSGRMLLAYAEQKRPRELVGQDVDGRCVKMTAINLALRNLYGFVLWGNSLTNEVKVGYRTGMNMSGGFVRYIRPGELADRFSSPHTSPEAPHTQPVLLPSTRPEGPATQLKLF